MHKVAIKIIIILVIILSASVIKGLDCNELSDLKWLLGDWQVTNENTIVKESWKQVSNKTFEGSGQSIDRKTGKIKFSESMRIVAMSDNIFYLAKVKENKFPVSFQLTMCDNKLALFENPEHDFPKKLGFYMDKDDLVVDVLGKDDKGYTIHYKASFDTK
jgi:hypothetical protein